MPFCQPQGLSSIFRKCKGWSSRAIRYCQILCYWLLMLWKLPSVEGNPLTQRLRQGALQIVFQGGLCAKRNGKGGKACLCVCVCMAGWMGVYPQVQTSSLCVLFSTKCTSHLTRAPERSSKIVNTWAKLLSYFPKLTIKLDSCGDHTTEVSNMCFISYKYTLLYTSSHITFISPQIKHATCKIMKVIEIDIQTYRCKLCTIYMRM